MNQLWEAFIWKDSEKCHKYTRCYKPQELLHTAEASKKLQTSELLQTYKKASGQLNGQSFGAYLSCTKQMALQPIASVCPQPLPEWSAGNYTSFLVTPFPVLLQKGLRLGWSKCNSTSLTALQFSAELITASQQIQSFHQAREFWDILYPNSSIHHSQCNKYAIDTKHYKCL